MGYSAAQVTTGEWKHFSFKYCPAKLVSYAEWSRLLSSVSLAAVPHSPSPVPLMYPVLYRHSAAGPPKELTV